MAVTMPRWKCIILGASGLVGQRLQQRLANHPMFEIAAVAGSPKSSGKKLSEIPWRLSEPKPVLPELEIIDANHQDLAEKCRSLDVKVAFSGLPSDIAKSVEKLLTDGGIKVFSNASSYRRVKGIPMIIPEINSQHFHNSLHYCATNCTLIPMALPMAAISQIAEIKSVSMHSEQALSGAGWELLFDPDAIAGKQDPEIPGEAEKTAAELLHVLGVMTQQEVKPAKFPTDIKCRRVSRLDGHQVFVKVRTNKVIDPQILEQKLRSISLSKELPSRPKKAIHIVENIDVTKHLWTDGENFSSNPNPADDLKIGMSIVVGNISVDKNLISFSAYSHNTIRGAAGGLVYLAEHVLTT